MGNDTYAYYMHFERMANADLGELIENTINSITSSSNNANKDPGYSVLQNQSGQKSSHSQMLLLPEAFRPQPYRCGNLS